MGGSYPELFWGFALFFLGPFAVVLAFLSFRAGRSSISISLRLLQMSGAMFVFFFGVFLGFLYSTHGARWVACLIALLPPIFYSILIDRFLTQRQATILAATTSAIGFLWILVLFQGKRMSDYILSAMGIWIFYTAAKYMRKKL